MKVLHLGKYYDPIVGGIESVTKLVVDSLPEDIHHIICFNNFSKTVIEENGKIRVFRTACYGKLAKQPLSFQYFSVLKKELKDFMPDVVHFHYPNPLVALYILFCIPSKIKLIVHWHSDIVEQKILWRIISPIEQKILNRSTRIIVTSENYAKASMPLLKYISKITIIPCGIDEEKFVLTNRDLGEVSKIRDRYKNKPIIFFVGRHVEYKGIKYLLEAEKYIQSDCEIVIAGEGPLTESLKTKYRSNRINWIGRLSSEDLKLFYHSADIFSFPSITRNEAFGVVLAEAMYCRCVPVTFTIEGSGVNWVTLNGITGLEVPNRDVVSYAKALDLLIKNQELRSTLANNGYKRVNDLFTFSRVGISIRHLYESIIKY